jgi:hypothetical protein
MALLRARCEMAAGRCDEGKRHYREARAAWARDNDKTGNVTDASLDADAETMARSTCKSAQAGGAQPQMGAIAALQKIMQAQAAHDVDGCVGAGHSLERLAATGDPVAKQAATGGLRAAAMCAADGGRCDDARGLWRSYMAGFMPGVDAEAAFKQNVAACAKR